MTRCATCNGRRRSLPVLLCDMLADETLNRVDTDECLNNCCCCVSEGCNYTRNNQTFGSLLSSTLKLTVKIHTDTRRQVKRPVKTRVNRRGR